MIDKTCAKPAAVSAPEQGIRWLPLIFVQDLCHFEFGRLDYYKKRIKWDKMREFSVQLMNAESEYFAANLGTKKNKDVKAAYGEADIKVTDILRRQHQDRNGSTIRINSEERDILAQLRKYIQMRQQIVQLYRDTVTFLHDGPLDYHDIAERTHTIMASMLGYLQHPELIIMRYNAEYELSALYLLFQALHHIARFQSRDAMQNLCRMKAMLANWKAFQRRSHEQLCSGETNSPDKKPQSEGPSSFWSRTPQYSLQQFFSSLGNSSLLSCRSPSLTEMSSEERTLPIPMAEEAATSTSLAVSPPCTSFIPSVSSEFSPAVHTVKMRYDQDLECKMDVDNKLFEWLCGAATRAMAKYTFIFQEVLLASRMRMYPKDRYQWADNKGNSPLDLLGPPVSELRKPFRSGSNLSSSSFTNKELPRTSQATIAALQSKVNDARPLSLADSQMDPIKKMVDFCRANPCCTVVVLLDTSKLDSFSPSGCSLLHSVGSDPDSSDTNSLSFYSTIYNDSSLDSGARELRSRPAATAMHVQCCRVTFCQHAIENRNPTSFSDTDSPQLKRQGIDAFHVIMQHPRGGAVDLAQDAGLKATIVSLILNSQEFLAKEAAPHQGRVLHVPPSEGDRVPYAFYISQIDQLAYACVISEKVKEKSKNVATYITRLTDMMRDSNQLGYLVTPKFDYEKNLI